MYRVVTIRPLKNEKGYWLVGIITSNSLDGKQSVQLLQCGAFGCGTRSRGWRAVVSCDRHVVCRSVLLSRNIYCCGYTWWFTTWSQPLFSGRLWMWVGRDGRLGETWANMSMSDGTCVAIERTTKVRQFFFRTSKPTLMKWSVMCIRLMHVHELQRKIWSS